MIEAPCPPWTSAMASGAPTAPQWPEPSKVLSPHQPRIAGGGKPGQAAARRGGLMRGCQLAGRAADGTPAPAASAAPAAGRRLRAPSRCGIQGGQRVVSSPRTWSRNVGECQSMMITVSLIAASDPPHERLARRQRPPIDCHQPGALHSARPRDSQSQLTTVGASVIIGAESG